MIGTKQGILNAECIRIESIYAFDENDWLVEIQKIKGDE